MEKKFSKLSANRAMTLARNDFVYLTDPGCDGFERVPAIVADRNASWLRVTYNGECGPVSRGFPFFTYGDAWFVEREEGFMVETPVGVLHAWDKEDKMYPGICIDLYSSGYSEGAWPITLAMTEYTPGDEGLCGLDLSRLWRTQEQIDEVPVERIVDEDGKPITHKMGVTASSGHTITAGLVTRTWPNEVGDEDYHRRTFHIIKEGEDK